jgi:adenylosuccinate synthase
MIHSAIIGVQWGDEGKGKIVDYLAKTHSAVVRYQGGNNAGHTVVVGNETFPLHLIPSGILHRRISCVIGDEVVIDPAVLKKEVLAIDKRVKKRAVLYVSKRAPVIMPWHVALDMITGKKIGTTNRGIGPTYTDAVARRGMRVMDFLHPSGKERLEEQFKWYQATMPGIGRLYGTKPKEIEIFELEKIWERYVKLFKDLGKLGLEFIDCGDLLSKIQKQGKRILFEGAQATLLDITHGDYPFVTSSHPTIGGIAIGSGFRPRGLEVIGVCKAYATRVGEGPFATELFDETAEYIRAKGREFGTTTGRPRRCGWLDLAAVRYGVRVSGIDALAITKLDILSGLPQIKVATGYKIQGKRQDVYPAETHLKAEAEPVYRTFTGWTEDITKVKVEADLPVNARKLLSFIKVGAGIPIRYVGVGPKRTQLIHLAEASE